MFYKQLFTFWNKLKNEKRYCYGQLYLKNFGKKCPVAILIFLNIFI